MRGFVCGSECGICLECILVCLISRYTRVSFQYMTRLTRMALFYPFKVHVLDVEDESVSSEEQGSQGNMVRSGLTNLTVPGRLRHSQAAPSPSHDEHPKECGSVVITIQ